MDGDNLERIFSGNVLAPTFLTEFVEFNRERPYTISIKYFVEEDVAIPHYSDSFEILLCNNLMGEVIMDAVSYSLGGYQVFCIPPNHIHSILVHPCEGSMHVIKISFSEIGYFLQLNHICAFSGKQMIIRSEDERLYRQLLQIVKDMIRADDDVFSRIEGILTIFKTLHDKTYNGILQPLDHSYEDNSALKALMDWTEVNYPAKLSVEVAARITGYSKHYFCRWFKRQTGMTYIDFLNRVRIDNARKLLLSGRHVGEVCQLCGYESVSYFIKKFRLYCNCTPKGYMSMFNADST